MKTVEEKKIEKLPRYIKTEELDALLNSDEMKNLVKQLEIIEEYREKTKNISIGEY